jgi:hypothetical protein
LYTCFKVSDSTFPTIGSIASARTEIRAVKEIDWKNSYAYLFVHWSEMAREPPEAWLASSWGFICRRKGRLELKKGLRRYSFRRWLYMPEVKTQCFE